MKNKNAKWEYIKIKEIEEEPLYRASYVMYPFSNLHGSYQNIDPAKVLVLGGWKPMQNLDSCLQYDPTDRSFDFVTKPGEKIEDTENNEDVHLKLERGDKFTK